MSVHIVLPCLFIAALASASYAAGNEQNSIDVVLKDTHGKPAAGVKLWLERSHGKAPARETVTNSTGQATFTNIAAGTYKVSAYDARTPAAAATMVDSRADRSTSVSLSLGKMV